MPNIRRMLSAVAGLTLVAGCGPSGNGPGSSDTARQTSSSENRAPTPSSRDTNAPSRVYSDTYGSNATKDADNTGRNARDRSGATVTSGDQGNSDTDREITQRIRRALSTNDQFSVMAKNIKIITVNGKVTLRGPVQSAEEQQAVFTAAQNAAGQAAVDNQLEVKAANQ